MISYNFNIPNDTRGMKANLTIYNSSKSDQPFCSYEGAQGTTDIHTCQTDNPPFWLLFSRVKSTNKKYNPETFDKTEKTCARKRTATKDSLKWF